MRLFVLFFCVTSLLSAAGNNTMRLVDNGVPCAEIILKAPASRSAQLGAFELQHHIKMISNATLPIVAEPSEKTVIHIYIGNPPEPLSFQDSGEMSRRIFLKNSIVLTGFDSSDFGKVDYSRVETFPMIDPSRDYVYNGSLFAVYDFLEDLCSIRFLWLDESGTSFQPRKTIDVVCLPREHRSPMDAFRVVHRSGVKKLSISARNLALWSLRWRMGSFFGLTNHNAYSIYFAHYGKARSQGLQNAFIEKRLEYFAQGYEGKGGGGGSILRSNYPGDNNLPPQLCYSNPGTIEFMAQEVLAYARGGNIPGGWKNRGGTVPPDTTLIPRFPEKPFFYPIEGADNGSFCQCKVCMERSDGDIRNVSNAKFQFMSDIANRVAQEDPGAGVSTLAYIYSLKYPEGVKLAPNLSVQLCLPIYTWWHPTAERLQRAAYKEWVTKEAHRRPLTLWTYLFSPQWDAAAHFGGYKCFPGLYPRKTISLMKEFVADGIRGWFTEVSSFNHSWIEAYLAARVCYDPTVDAEAMMQDFLVSAFGEAAPKMEEFLRCIEDAYWSTQYCPERWFKDSDVLLGPRGGKHPYWSVGLHAPEFNWQLGTDERMKKLTDLLREAGSKVRLPHEIASYERIRQQIWEPAMEGKKEFLEVQEKVAKAPRMQIRLCPDAQGNPETITWEDAAHSGTFTDFFGRDIKNTSSIDLAADKNYLYFRFAEQKKPDVTRPHGYENIEIFFAANREFPVFQLIIGANGIIQGYRREYSIEPWESGARVINRVREDSWEILMSIPLGSLPWRDGVVAANVFRSWDWKNGGAAVWSPVYYTRLFISGLPYFGSWHLPDDLITP